jgi:hypothetical protein
MGDTVQARLDSKTRAALERVASRLGWSTSKVVREGIHLVEKRHNPAPVRGLIGIGMFDSGTSDLATNKEHMKDFGAKSMGKGWRRPEERGNKRKAHTK